MSENVIEVEDRWKCHFIAYDGCRNTCTLPGGPLVCGDVGNSDVPADCPLRKGPVIVKRGKPVECRNCGKWFRASPEADDE